MWKKIDGMMKKVRFGFPEVDGDLNGWEILVALILGVGICLAPFLIKWILIVVNFGGM